jgi:hypothetical protein
MGYRMIYRDHLENKLMGRSWQRKDMGILNMDKRTIKWKDTMVCPLNNNKLSDI